MCGISLCIAPDARRANQGIDAMICAQHHRGPDAQGRFLAPLPDGDTLAIGHNRLSIIDLSDHAAQPMQSADGRYVLAYNGEVYNYREIARELYGDDAERHSGEGDTAVLLAALIAWGPAAFAKLNGMWALALYDRQEQTLLVSRDRFGKKPIYLHTSAEGFFLASEVKSILSAAGGRFAINPRVAVPYLTRGLVNFSLETFFEGITLFPPASYEIIRLEPGATIGRNPQRYWEHPFERGIVPEAGSVTPEEVRETFIDSVRLRLRSDVPLGVLLSGGIDSSAIVGAIAKLGALDNVSVLSVVSENRETNEEPFIDAMTRFVGCRTHKVNVSEDPLALLATLERATWHNDAPFSAFSSLAHMELMRLAGREGMKVLLTGQGSDEQLGGYNKFFYFYLFSLLREHRYVEAARTLAQFARNSNTLYEFRLSEAMRYVGRRRLAQGTFIPEAAQQLDDVDIGFGGSYPRREWLDLTATSVPQLLHTEDRMSMSCSIEMRVPFLDFRLVELLARVAPSEKFAGGWTKSIFRTAIKGLVPDEIRFRRDKKGFAVPSEDWMRTILKPTVDELFRSDLLSERIGLVDGAALRDRYDRFAEGRGTLNGRQFFRAYSFEIFLRRFADSIDFDTAASPAAAA